MTRVPLLGRRLDTEVSCVNEWCSSHVPVDHQFADGNATPAGTWTRYNYWSCGPPPSLFISRTRSSGPCWVTRSQRFKHPRSLIGIEGTYEKIPLRFSRRVLWFDFRKEDRTHWRGRIFGTRTGSSFAMRTKLTMKCSSLWYTTSAKRKCDSQRCRLLQLRTQMLVSFQVSSRSLTVCNGCVRDN